MVPHLSTALSGPLLDLERRILEAQPAIEYWLRTQWLEHTPPFYSSVDLRNSGFKLAPVDTNLFPGGFNNLNPDFLPLCVQATQSAIEKICPEARGVLIVPESHTRNQYYLQNVVMLSTILKQAGLNVRVGSLLPDITAPTPIELSSGATVTLIDADSGRALLRLGRFRFVVVVVVMVSSAAGAHTSRALLVPFGEVAEHVFEGLSVAPKLEEHPALRDRETE